MTSVAEPVEEAAAPGPWEQVGRELADHLAVDAAERDRAGKAPVEEIACIRESGLLTALAPPSPDGHGMDWPTACRVVRRMAAADSSLAELLGRHYVLSWSGRFLMAADRGPSWESRTTGRGWLLAGEVGADTAGADTGDERSLDDALTLTTDDGGYRLSGRGVPVPGALVADRVLLPARHAGTRESHMAVLVDPAATGVTTDPVDDLFGQRLTGAGVLSCDHLHVADDQLVGVVATDDELAPPVSALASLALRMMTAHVVLGIAEGALAEARDAILVTSHTCAPYRRRYDSAFPSAAADPDLLQAYGELAAAVHVSATVVEHASHALADGARHGPELDTVHSSGIAASVATAEATASESALHVTARVMELVDAADMDRFWRNVRSLTAHRAPARELRAIGEHFLYSPGAAYALGS